MFYESSRPDVFCKKGVLRNFGKFTGKHSCQRLYFNKVAGQAFLLWNLCRKSFRRRVFLRNFLEIIS